MFVLIFMKAKVKDTTYSQPVTNASTNVAFLCLTNTRFIIEHNGFVHQPRMDRHYILRGRP